MSQVIVIKNSLKIALYYPSGSEINVLKLLENNWVETNIYKANPCICSISMIQQFPIY